jgi:chromosome segregation ATPase
MGAMVMAALLMTSCIDTSVSEEIKNLRAAQASWVQAQADLAAAEAEAQVIQNEYDAAINALDVTEATAELEESLAWIEYQIAAAQTNLQAQQQQLEVAIAAYEKYINEQGVTQAAAALNSYSAASLSLNNMINSRLTTVANLARAEAILNSTNSTWEVQEAALNVQLVTQQATLAAAEGQLADLIAVQEDPTIKTDKINELIAENQDLNNQIASLQIDLAVAQQTKSETAAALTNGQADVTAYNTAVSTHTTAVAALPALNTAVTTATTDLATKNAELTVLKSELASLEAALLPYTNAKTAAKTALDAANAELAAAQLAYDIAVAKNDATPTAANQTAEDAALATRDAKQTAKNTKQTDYDNAVTDITETGFEADITSKKAEITTKEGQIVTATATLETSQKAVELQEANIANYAADVTRLKPARDAAIAAWETMQAADLAAADAVAVINAQIAPKQATVTFNTTTLTALNAVNLNGAIAAAQTAVTNARNAIAGTEISLQNNELSRAGQADVVANYELDLEILDAQIAAQTEIVAQWKDILDAIIEG